MKFPVIPPWLLPWKARKVIANLDDALVLAELSRGEAAKALDVERSERQRLSARVSELLVSVDDERAKSKNATDNAQVILSQKMEFEQKNKRAIGALLAWIYSTHKIDQRADQHGLTDILKDFPPIR